MSRINPTKETYYGNYLCQREIPQTKQLTETHYVKTRFYKRDRPRKLTMSKIDSTNETDHGNAMSKRDSINETDHRNSLCQR